MGVRAGLSILAILTLAIAGRELSARAAPSSPPISFISVQMVSPQLGWALAAHRVLKTTDGGRRWTTVRVPALPVRNRFYFAMSVRDENTVWLAPPVFVNQSSFHSVVLSTTDGGQHWRRSNLIRGTTGSATDFSWVTLRLGWLLMGEGAAAGSVATDIYRTVDGGLHWRLVSYNRLSTHSPSSISGCNGFAGISFRTPNDGWAAGTCGPGPMMIMLYRTHDGGLRWRLHHLRPPASSTSRPVAWSLIPPTLFGKVGFLPAIVDPPRAFVLYVTRNGGNTWSPTAPVRDRSFTEPDVFVLDPHHVWARLGRNLQYSSDGGKHWQLIHRFPGSGSAWLEFVNPSIGFTSGIEGQRLFLLESNNGGRAWHRV